MKLYKHLLSFLIAIICMVTVKAQQFLTVKNTKGPTLGYAPESGVQILKINGLFFKDLNKNGKLDKYEDWRLPVDERAKDLASKMSVAQMAGLMLYSGHQSIPAAPRGFGSATYDGKTFPESKANAFDLSDQQKIFLRDDNVRHVLVTSVQSTEVAAKWSNNVQAFVEGLGLGIPANNSSDPRNGVLATAEYNLGSGGAISMWPESIGLAATFDPTIVEKFGHIAAQEYRALGITTALSPQIDLGTEPRWGRINGTFGEDAWLDADMARAYVDGFQTSFDKDEIKNGWGYKSVNTMVKHWPSGGPEEGGRDGHFAYGKFAVYPGKNFNMHLIPFIKGAFQLKGKTAMASAVMPYYTISFNQDTVYHENVGNGYSKYIITDLLRNKYKYDGVVCTDWLVIGDEGKTPDMFMGKSWGMENKTNAERHYKVIKAGGDQFGGNNDMKPVLEAYQMGVKEFGEAAIRARFEQSAIRLLRNIFRVGLFENPYLEVASSISTVGNASFMKAGYEAQIKSIVLLKNKNAVLPIAKNKTVYIPKKIIPAGRDWFGNVSEEKIVDPVAASLVKKYFNITDDPSKADFAIVFVNSPNGSTGYDLEDRKKGNNGYLPITLQYGPYTANDARAKSIAAGDPIIDPTITNRSYKGKTVTASNSKDLDLILNTKKLMNGKPVIVSITANKPMIFSEFESQVEGIVMNFGVQNQSILDIISGASEPSGLLPLQMPVDMKTVELQMEDVPHDMQVHIDTENHAYDFGYGLNWKGVIQDARKLKYTLKKK
jgi:beta-glucosidase